MELQRLLQSLCPNLILKIHFIAKYIHFIAINFISFFVKLYIVLQDTLIPIAILLSKRSSKEQTNYKQGYFTINSNFPTPPSTLFIVPVP
jgi:hypothetical protein